MFNRPPIVHQTTAEADNFLGTPGTFSFCVEDCSIRYHDGCCCGGKILNAEDEPFDPSALEARLAALEAQNPVVDTEVIAGTNDILVTYLDGTTETLDQVEVSASTDGAGLITFDIDGSPFGPFDTGAHAIDTDTFSTAVDNGDGTITVTYADASTATYATGSHTVDTDTFSTAVDNGDGTFTITYAGGQTATFATGPHAVDTDTTYVFVANANGSITVTGSDGSTFTGPAGTVDTDTFATLAGQVITFAGGTTLDLSTYLDNTDEEVGANVVADGVVIDPADTSTWPALVAPAKIQMVVDATGNFVGFIDASGPHKPAAGITKRRLASDNANSTVDISNIASASTTDTIPLAVPVVLTEPTVVTFSLITRVEFFVNGVSGRQLSAAFRIYDNLSAAAFGAQVPWRDFVDTSTTDGNTISGTVSLLIPAGTYEFNSVLVMQTNNLDPASVVFQIGSYLEATWLEEQ